MEAPSSLPRDLDGIPRGKCKVPRRIGRPPVWTSTRSRKLARLYMYTTLSVDNILKVLEDDMFKPKKNSAQKTIHNMLGCDPRYLRPESREDMNQRIKLLSASSRRNRGMGKNPSDPSPEAAFPSPPLPPPTYCDVRLHNEMGQSDISMSQNPCHPLDLPLQSQFPHQQHSAHDVPLYLPPLPPLPTPQLYDHGLFVHSRTHKSFTYWQVVAFVVATNMINSVDCFWVSMH